MSGYRKLATNSDYIGHRPVLLQLPSCLSTDCANAGNAGDNCTCEHGLVSWLMLRRCSGKDAHGAQAQHHADCRTPTYPHTTVSNDEAAGRYFIRAAAAPAGTCAEPPQHVCSGAGTAMSSREKKLLRADTSAEQKWVLSMGASCTGACSMPLLKCMRTKQRQ